MATSKSRMLKEQITFDFFETTQQVMNIKPKKEKVESQKEQKKSFRKKHKNVKHNHIKEHRKVRIVKW